MLPAEGGAEVAAAGDWWDLRSWDDEDEAAQETATPASRARAGRRRGRPIDVGWDDDEGEWEEAHPLARRRRGPGWREGDDQAAGSDGTRGPDAVALDEQWALARLRMVAGDYSPTRALARLAAMFVLTAAAAAAALVRRGGGAARRVLRPWGAFVRQSGGIRKQRAAVHRIRSAPDRALSAVQARGVRRFRATLRSRSVPPVASRDGDRVVVSAAVFVALAVVAYGTRHLLVGHLPTIGELGPWPSLGALSRAATSGWRVTGLGTSAAAPSVFGLLTIAGTVVLGHTTLLQHVLVLGMIPLGAVGVLRLARPLGSPRTRVVAMVAYLVVPLPYNALAEGRWTGLVGYAALPWLLGLLVRATGQTPFADAAVARSGSGRPARPPLSTGRRVVAAALLLGLAGAVEPALLPLAVMVAVALALGTAITGPAGAAHRPVLLAVVGAAGAAVLLAPWSVGWLPPVGEWAGFSGPAAGGHAAHLSTLLRFQTGPLGAGPLGYALLLVAAFPLVVGRDWRAAWATRLWAVALASFAVAWAAQHGALGIGWPPADVLLAPAAAAIACSAGLGMAAFELDLPGSTFGWRQVASVVVAVAAVAACLPVLLASVDGRWHQPATGFDGVLPWMAAKRADGDFRVLWVGGPGVLPIAGWRLDARTAYATSVDGPPGLTDQWPGSSRGPTRLLGQALTLTRRGLTTQVGHLLAPMGVRYVVVVDSPSPLTTTSTQTQAVAPDLRVGLDSQLDLETVDHSYAMTVYQNDAWAPLRVQLPDGAVGPAQLDDPRVARTVNLGSAASVLPHPSGPTTARGTLGAGAVVEVAAAPSSHWRLRVGGIDAGRQPAFGSANLFTTRAGGAATLSYVTPLGWHLALVGEAILWVLALGVVARGRRRPAERDDQPGPSPASPSVLFSPPRSGPDGSDHATVGVSPSGGALLGRSPSPGAAP